MLVQVLPCASCWHRCSRCRNRAAPCFVGLNPTLYRVLSLLYRFNVCFPMRSASRKFRDRDNICLVLVAPVNIHRVAQLPGFHPVSHFQYPLMDHVLFLQCQCGARSGGTRNLLAVQDLHDLVPAAGVALQSRPTGHRPTRTQSGGRGCSQAASVRSSRQDRRTGASHGKATGGAGRATTAAAPTRSLRGSANALPTTRTTSASVRSAGPAT